MSLALKQSKAASGATFGGAFMPRSQFQGDPGLFGFLGKVAGTALNVATGGVSGSIANIFRKPAQTTVAGPSIIQQQGGPGGGAFAGNLFQQSVPVTPTPGLKGFGQRLFPGGATGFEVSTNGKGMGGPAGHHLNKSDYFLKDGTFVPKGSKWVKNRRRNPLNPRAASRAISRIEAGKRATGALDRVSIKCKRCGLVKCTCRR